MCCIVLTTFSSYVLLKQMDKEIFYSFPMAKIEKQQRKNNKTPRTTIVVWKVYYVQYILKFTTNALDFQTCISWYNKQLLPDLNCVYLNIALSLNIFSKRTHRQQAMVSSGLECAGCFDTVLETYTDVEKAHVCFCNVLVDGRPVFCQPHLTIYRHTFYLFLVFVYVKMLWAVHQFSTSSH